MRDLRPGGAAVSGWRSMLFKTGGWLMACAMASSASAQAPVGMMERQWSDPSRLAWGGDTARPLRVTLWYPAGGGAPTSVPPAGPFAVAPVALGAAPATSSARLPLLLLSHGTGGSAVSLAWLAHAMAAQGYVVAGVDHHGNTGAEPAYRLEAFLSWWDRPRDLSVMLDQLLADPLWGPRIDADRIGVMGFSLGGYTALASVGARLDPTALAELHKACAEGGDCLLPPEIASRHSGADVGLLLKEDARLKASVARAGDDYRDPRLRAALALAPVMGRLISASSLAAICVPLHVVASEADDQAPPALTARPVVAQVPGATLQLLSGASHYSFLSPCTEFGRQVAAPICHDPEGTPRALIHRQVQLAARTFFARALAPR